MWLQQQHELWLRLWLLSFPNRNAKQKAPCQLTGGLHTYIAKQLLTIGAKAAFYHGNQFSDFFGKLVRIVQQIRYAVCPSVRYTNLQSLSPKFHIVYHVLFLYGEQRMFSPLDCNFL